MNFATRWRRHVLGGSGLVLVMAGLVTGFGWHYLMAPAMRLADPAWRAAHSEAERWAEEQKDYHRRGASPDLCMRGDRIGFYGDKAWFLWLEERIRHPETFRHCGCTQYALTLMSNRLAPSWREWAETNRNLSQEEWIREGFDAYGVAVHLPPDSADVVPLLKLLGRESWNVLWGRPEEVNPATAVPSFVHYNAYRWLRDSGFDPAVFVSSERSLASEPEVMSGLMNFFKWRAVYPGNDGLGVLALGQQKATGYQPEARRFVGLHLAINLFIGVSVLGGGVLAWRSFKSESPGR